MFFRGKKEINNKGYSLAEISVVILISGILLMIASSLYKSQTTNSNLREAAGDLMSDIKLAKQRAAAEYSERVSNVEYDVNYRITIDKDNNKYSVQGYYVKDGATIYKYNVTKNLTNYGKGIKILDNTYGANTITFQNRGTCSNGHITLQNSLGSNITITTSLMGRVKSEETYMH
ncbi:MAG: prepilin-type N-terminal cleavage/methylation domain-containing protein [Deltaproteobacteria bacterium]|nr:prepilin-type N-terminal cleavage/methylation domain-containing protein [Deltaproteobacteria bacterium]